MTKQAKKLLTIRLVAAVVLTLAYILCAAVEFNREILAPIIVIAIIAVLFIPLPGQRAAAQAAAEQEKQLLRGN